MTTISVIRALAIGAGLVVGSSARAQSPSPAERAVANARGAIAGAPRSYESYNELAFALARRARETADAAYYDQAQQAVATSLALAPGNFEAEKLLVWVLLGKHEFSRALERAKVLNERVPDDLQVYGFLTDAHVELGHYEEAEEACQWLLNLRPGNVAGLTRAAYLRELFGQIEGAIELMREAYERTPPNEIEDRAWLLTQLGHLELLAGRAASAEMLLDEALKLFPDYHYALANLAKVRTAQGRHADAVALLEKHVTVAPHPENVFGLAEALERAGRHADARAAFAQFEARARAESQRWDNANRELVLYYADYANKPAEALKLAEFEIARRQDVHTLDVYAWALYVNHRQREAQAASDRALAVGIKDPAILARASTIAAAGGTRARQAATEPK